MGILAGVWPIKHGHLACIFVKVFSIVSESESWKQGHVVNMIARANML